MRLLIAFLMCMVFSLSVEAQHRRYLANKGDRVDYDTAVVVNIAAYRKDVQLLKHKDFLIDSLLQVNDSYSQKNQLSIMAQQNMEEAVDKSIIGLNESQASQKQKNKWYRNPVLGLGLGMLIGIYLVPGNSL